MKLLDNANFAHLSALLSTENSEMRLITRLESYSCKMAGQDKKMYKETMSNAGAEGTAAVQLLSAASGSPGSWQSANDMFHSTYGTSGDFQSSELPQYPVSTKTLYYLKATLNAAFAPDYDFSHAHADEFCREASVEYVSRKVDANFVAALGDDYSDMAYSLWQAIGDEIDPAACEIFSYTPDMESDPFNEEGVLWSYNYLLYNKKMKRLVFFACRAIAVPRSAISDMAFADQLGATEFAMEDIGAAEEVAFGYDDGYGAGAHGGDY